MNRRMQRHRDEIRPTIESLHHEAGVSIVEVLIAALIMLFVAVGLIPLFTMAMGSNLQGHDSTLAANFARARLEQLLQVPFDDPLLEVTAGNSRVIYETYDKVTRQWTTVADFSALPVNTLWTRTTTIQQYNIIQMLQAAAASPPGAPIPLPAGTAPATEINLKEIQVEVDSKRPGGPFPGGKSVTVRAYKSS